MKIRLAISELYSPVSIIPHFYWAARYSMSSVSALKEALVSVVMPAYNGELYIGESIKSIFGQSYSNIEVVVVDDGSSDRTRDIVRSFGGRVRLLEQKNQGAAAARNLGIQMALGEYIAFLDADDVWWPRKLELQIAAMRAGGFKMAYSRFIVWQEDLNGQFPPAADQFERVNHPNRSKAKIVTGWNYAELLMDCVVWTSTVVVETQALRQIDLFDTQLRKGQDYDLWLRLSRQLPMLGIEQATALYRTNRDSVTYKLSDECYEYTILVSAVSQWGESGPDQRAPAAGALTRRMRRILLDHGIAHYQRGSSAVAVRSLKALLKNHGFQVKPAIYLLLAQLKQWRTQAFQH